MLLGDQMILKKKKSVFSAKTRNNILLDMSMLLAGLSSVISGIYFLFLPVGGYQGGRNPTYEMVIFFERHTWSQIHTWGSVLIIALAALHIPFHWSWIVKMTRSGLRTVSGKGNLNIYSQFNLGINILIGISGLLCGLSGLFFLFEQSLLSISAGDWIFTRLTWDLVHTWSGVAFTAAAILHFGIHWRWAIKVLKKYGLAFLEGFLAGQKDPLIEPVSANVANENRIN
jgi:hypothetical protein